MDTSRGTSTNAQNMEDTEPQFDPFWFNPVSYWKWWCQRLTSQLRTIKERGGWSYVYAWCIDWFIMQAYLVDWIIAIGGYIFSNTVPLKVIPANDFYITPADPTLSYPYQNGFSKDPCTNIGLFMWMVPLVIIGITSIAMCNFYDLHTAVLGLVWTHCIGCNFKQFMNIVGYPRPYWFSVNNEGEFPYPNALETEIKFARQSFPSGHASYTTQAMTFIFCYLLAKFRIMQNPGPGHLVKLLVTFSPLMLAAYVSMTRITRYIHHPADVTCGMFIGVAFGVAGYFVFYPSLWHPRCWLPTPRRLQLAWEAKWGGGADQAGAERGLQRAEGGQHHKRHRPGRRLPHQVPTRRRCGAVRLPVTVSRH